MFKTKEQEQKIKFISSLDSMIGSAVCLSEAELEKYKKMKLETLENLISEVHEKKIRHDFMRDGKMYHFTEVIDDNGKRIQKSVINDGTEEKECEFYQKLYDFYFGNNKKTFAIVFEEYFQSMKPKWKDGGKKVRTEYKGNIQGTDIDKMLITRIKGSDLDKFFQTFSEKTKRKKITNIKSIFNKVFDYEIAHDIVKNNIAREYNSGNVTAKANDEDPCDCYTDIDAELFRKYVDRSSIYDLAAAFHSYVDARAGEVFAIHISDISWEECKVWIHREIVERYDENGKGHYVEVQHNKSKKDLGRRFPLSDEAMEILKIAVGDRTEGYVFTGRKGGHLFLTPYLEHIAAVCNRAGIVYRGSHKFRFRAASKIALLTDDATAATVGGHSKWTVNHYKRMAQLMQEETLNAIRNAL